ncbi:SMI1/KNR4 family protein [Polymorphospora rubra]|uniref:SMI1/KNR4 family protein n=1 Tax=Polymorphospora rubra TaxID=338584 RepID=UPI0031D55B2D
MVVAEGAATPDRLETVWQAVADDLSSVEPQDADPVALAGLYDDLYGMFTEVGVTDVSARLALPADYVCFLALAGGDRWWRHSTYDESSFCLFGIDRVWSATDFSCRLWADRRPAGEPMWLTVAALSDRSELALCCDRADPRFGAVVECHDDHPWHAGNGLFSPRASFTDFLASLS